MIHLYAPDVKERIDDLFDFGQEGQEMLWIFVFRQCSNLMFDLINQSGQVGGPL